ncbi:hypothetical protein [Cohaesibacter haloalkalitolerans]|uniref:hypothetical protein n=1 Tax=Cohaesibacter haloalkalitolerans TaxID=1162980 RepID=UPI000E656028|nr:hypothetical protein [Cohaesibacter haloalkalitolerans]
MKKAILAGLIAAAFLASPAAEASSRLAVHMTQKSIPMAKVEAKRIFTRSTLGYSVTKETKTSLLFSKTFSESYGKNIVELRNRIKGNPVAQVELMFSKHGNRTKVTGDTWFILNPKGKNKDIYNTNHTKTYKDLKRLLAEIR